MAVPKKKTSSTRRNKRRAHDFLTFKSISTCPNCGAARMPHRVCKACGYYDGKVRMVIGDAIAE